PVLHGTDLLSLPARGSGIVRPERAATIAVGRTDAGSVCLRCMSTGPIRLEHMGAVRRRGAVRRQQIGSADRQIIAHGGDPSAVQEPPAVDDRNLTLRSRQVLVPDRFEVFTGRTN